VTAVEVYRFELFDADGNNPRLRWFSPDGPVVERRMDRQEVDGLIDRVATGYQTSKPDLATLGAELYRWLDGPTERWLQAARARQQPILLYAAAQERLRGLPWELLSDEEGFLALHAARPVMPVRTASLRDTGAREVANRPLRVLFMASSPVGVAPVLDFEAEEAVILDAAAGRVEVVVEESGSLTGLAERLSWFGPGYFDVLHLSGHGFIGPAGARFVMEDEHGRRADVAARDIAAAARGVWPYLVFVSGCYTAGSPEAGLVASMAEALVDAGAAAVLGWALPVGDVSASSLAATLYRQLGSGVGIAESVTAARRALFDGHSDWHLLRLYADRSGLGAVVTRLGTPERVRLRTREASTLFLDAVGRVKVANRASFVGRRRDLQALLRELRPDDPTEGPQIALLHGMGGLGKSSLAARLLDRIRTTHGEHAVWVGKVDPLAVASLTQRLTLTEELDRKVNDLLSRDSIPLADRLRYVLDGPLANTPCVFVFDDFEDGNLEPDGLGGHRCTAESLEVLQAFGTAISRTGSPSRVVITSRYDFALPAQLHVVRQPIGELQGADLEKKLRLTENLGPTSQIDPVVRERAIAVAAGIPRLLERLDSLIAMDLGDLDARFAAIEKTEIDFREELLLQQLLEAQPSNVRRAIALAAVYEIAVPVDAILVLSPAHPISHDVHAAARVGLLQAGVHAATGEPRYLVSPLVRPLLDGIPERLNDHDLQHMQGRGARFLYEHWVQSDGQ
jgi:CHAT domain-containing protein